MMLDPLPRYIKVGRRRYRLLDDYRRVLLMMEIERDPRLTQAARTTLALRCLFRALPASRAKREDLLRQARRALFPATKRTENRRLTDIDQDADMIRAAFRQVYHIDLRREPLRWGDFTELMANLPEGTRYAEIIGVRAMDVPEPTKTNSKYRQAIINAKTAFALQSQSEADRMARYRASVHTVAESLKALAKKG